MGHCNCRSISPDRVGRGLCLECFPCAAFETIRVEHFASDADVYHQYLHARLRRVFWRLVDESERTAGGRAHSGRVLRFGCFSDDLLREQALVAVSQLRVYRRYRSWTWLYRSGRRAGEMVP